MLIIKHQRDYTEFRRVYFLTECFIVSRRIRRKRRLAHTLRLCCWRLCRVLTSRRSSTSEASALLCHLFHLLTKRDPWIFVLSVGCLLPSRWVPFPTDGHWLPQIWQVAIALAGLRRKSYLYTIIFVLIHSNTKVMYFSYKYHNHP